MAEANDQSQTPSGSLKPELLQEPFRDGFTRRAIIGAFFLSAVMVPAAIYLSLLLGGGLTAAADWVTVILFLELARRSFQKLTRQEIMVLLHVAGSIGTGVGTTGLAGGVFGTLVWHSYLKTSSATKQFGLHEQLPAWVAPDATVIAQRTFWNAAWWPAVWVLLISFALNKIQGFVVGYLAYKITVDVEKLPFPMAPVWAQGSMALAEHSGRSESWRWNTFAVGAAMGATFAILSTLIPSITGTFLSAPIFILPNPWIDLSSSLRNILPATAIVISIDLGALLIGMILPWRVLIGSAIGMVVFQIIGNPILHAYGYLPQWQPGFSAVNTQLSNSLDFYLSQSLGCAIAVALAGFISVGYSFFKRRQKKSAGVLLDTDGLTQEQLRQYRRDRGDFNVWVMLGLFVVSSIGYIWLCHYLVPDFPLWIFTAFAFIYTPIMSYITARMQGIAGMGVGFPMAREGTFLLSGYERADVWFAPIPLHDYGGVAQWFRQMELTRTRFSSMLKAELLVIPIMMVASFVFWSYIWSLDPIPSEKYPLISTMWPAQAKMAALWSTARSSGADFLIHALKPEIIGTFAVGTLVVMGGFSLAGISLQYVYGFIAGSNTGIVHVMFLGLIGAILGRYVFAPRFGEQNFRRYVPVLLAGYACGAGLVGMLSMAIVFLQRSVTSLPY